MKHKWAVSSKSCNNNEAGIQKPTFWVSDGKGTDPKQRVLCPVLPLPSGAIRSKLLDLQERA